MTKDEVLRMALEAICGSGEFLFNWHDCEPNNEREMQSYQAVLAANEKAFTAIREVLAQPEQEPVIWHEAPQKTVWGAGMVCADIGPTKDNTATIYCEAEMTEKVEALLHQPAVQVGLEADSIIRAAIYWAKNYPDGEGYDDAAEGKIKQLSEMLKPAVPERKPLTDAQIGAVAADIWGSILIAPQSYQAFARAIEAKLKEKNT